MTKQDNRFKGSEMANSVRNGEKGGGRGDMCRPEANIVSYNLYNVVIFAAANFPLKS